MPIHYSEINEPFNYHNTSLIEYKLTGRNPKTPLQLESELINLLDQTDHPIKYIGFLKEETWKSTLSTVLYEHDKVTYTIIYSNFRKFIKDENWKPSKIKVSDYKVNHTIQQHKKLTGYDITVNSYNGSRSSLTIICHRHTVPYKWNTIYKDVNKAGCARCAGVAPLTRDEIRERVLDVCSEKYYKLEKINYNKTNSTIDLICSKGHMWSVSFGNLTHTKTNCPQCQTKDSRNFLVIDTLFENIQIEKRFDECRNIRPLPFDRYVEEYNLLIEYDGVQHFDKSNKWHSSENEIRDNIKTEFAISNNYNFLRISYRQDVTEVIRSYIMLLEENKNSQVIQIYDQITIK